MPGEPSPRPEPPRAAAFGHDGSVSSVVCGVCKDLRRGSSRHRRCSLHARGRASSFASVHRYYDPATGQFLSVDPAVGQTGQPYSYAEGDPVNGSDLLGLCTTPTGNANQPFAYTPGQCTPQQVQQIDQAAAAAQTAGPAQNCSNVFSCIWQDPGSIVASFNANRGTIEHAEEGVIGTAIFAAGVALTGGLLAPALAEGAAAADEVGGWLSVIEAADVGGRATIWALAGSFIGGGAALGTYGWYNLFLQAAGQATPCQ